MPKSSETTKKVEVKKENFFSLNGIKKRVQKTPAALKSTLNYLRHAATDSTLGRLSTTTAVTAGTLATQSLVRYGVQVAMPTALQTVATFALSTGTSAALIGAGYGGYKAVQFGRDSIRARLTANNAEQPKPMDIVASSDEKAVAKKLADEAVVVVVEKAAEKKEAAEKPVAEKTAKKPRRSSRLKK